MPDEDIGAWPIAVRVPAPSPIPTAADAVVIGGGVIGLLSALALRKQGRDVVVLEAANVGGAQSGRNMGFVREQGREAVEAGAMRRANAGWRALSAASGTGVGWTQGGHLSIAPDDEALERVADWGRIAEDAGVPFELLPGDRLRERFGWIGPSFAGAGYTPEDGHVDPRTAMRGIERLARAAGVTIVEGAAVDSLVVGAGRVLGVEVDGEELRAGLVVVAAGAWSGRLLRPAGIRLPLHAGRGTLGVTRPLPALTAASVWDMGGVGFRQSADGRIVFGLGAFVDVDVRWEDVRASFGLLPTLWRNRRTMRLHVGRPLAGDIGDLLAGRAPRPFAHLDPAPNPEHVHRGLELLGGLVPRFGSAEVEVSWAGIIESTPDFLPIVGDGGLANLLLAVGTSGHGMGLAPATADGLAAAAQSGAFPSYLSGFALDRFRRA